MLVELTASTSADKRPTLISKILERTISSLGRGTGAFDVGDTLVISRAQEVLGVDNVHVDAVNVYINACIMQVHGAKLEKVA